MKDYKHTASMTNRRDFLKSTGVAVLGSALPLSAGFAGPVSSQKANTLKVGLIGCGGRGTGVATQALAADPEVVLTAMGYVFAEHLEKSYKAILGESGSKVKVDKAHKFVGFDAYRKVTESG